MTSSRSRTTWRTASWSARRSALGFWICSETLRVHCGERPGEPETTPSPALEDPKVPGAGADIPFPAGCARQPQAKTRTDPIPAPRLGRDTTESLWAMVELPAGRAGTRLWRLALHGGCGGMRLSPVPLLLAFPPPGPHLCSEELVETVLLPAFAVKTQVSWG